MSTQPSSRLRPSTFGTSLRLVRYILAGGMPSLIFSAVFLNAFPKAAPNNSAFDVMTVLQGGDRLHVRRRNLCDRCRARGTHSSSRSRPPQAAPGCRACGQDPAQAACPFVAV